MTRKTTFAIGFLLASISGPILSRAHNNEMWRLYRISTPYDRQETDVGESWVRTRLLGIGDPIWTEYEQEKSFLSCYGIGGTLVVLRVHGDRKHEIMSRLERIIESGKLYEVNHP